MKDQQAAEQRATRMLDTLKTPAMILDATFREGTITNAVIRSYTERVMERSKDLPGELLHLIAMEVEGGDCPKCGKPWKLIHSHNVAKTLQGGVHAVLTDFDFYRPSCRCFGFCQRCGNSLHREVAGGVAPVCGSCGNDPRKPAFRPRRRHAAKKEDKLDQALEE